MKNKVKKIVLEKRFNGDMICPMCSIIYSGKMPKVSEYCGYCYVGDKLKAKENLGEN